MVDAVYPRRCAGCGRRGVWVCDDCRPTLIRCSPPWCDRCGAPVGTVPCICRELGPSLNAVRSAGLYDGWLRDAIIRFKYESERARADHLGELFLPLLDEMASDALVPVPLHPKRERARGYNQSAELAKRLQALTGVPRMDLLQRVRETVPQVGLGARERRLNVAGAFHARSDVDITELRLTLVDDVLTTGSTVEACADALIAAGAGAVAAITLARQT